MPKILHHDFVLALEAFTGDRNGPYQYKDFTYLGVTWKQICKAKQTHHKDIKVRQPAYDLIMACIKYRNSPHLRTIIKALKIQQKNLPRK